jgi:hypothetical protein
MVSEHLDERPRGPFRHAKQCRLVKAPSNQTTSCRQVVRESELPVRIHFAPGKTSQRSRCDILAAPLEPSMTDALILDLLEWLALKPRPYTEVMEAWRTSCPRFTVWEDALDRGFVVRRDVTGDDALIELTALGRSLLEASGRAAGR